MGCSLPAGDRRKCGRIPAGGRRGAQPYSGKSGFPQILRFLVGTRASRPRYRGKGGAQLQRKDFLMRKLLLASAAILTLGIAVPAVQAQERTNLAPAAGATTGATLGF